MEVAARCVSRVEETAEDAPVHVHNIHSVYLSGLHCQRRSEFMDVLSHLLVTLMEAEAGNASP